MAMQFSDEEKKKIIEDNSEIYKKRDDQTNGEDVKNLKGKAKRRYLREYYLGTAVAVVIIAILAVMFIHNAVKKSPATVLYVAIESDVVDDEKAAAFENEIEKYLGLDTEREVVAIDSNVTDQQLQTYLYSGTADIVIASEDKFKEWSQGGYFTDPEENADLTFYKEYSEEERFFSTYISADDVRDSSDLSNITASDGTEYNYGLYLTDSNKYKKNLGGYVRQPVIGISSTTKNMDYASEFVKYMMDNESSNITNENTK